ncbi:MAG: hypothetical protein PF444_09400 [Bacteroidales bacterium]|jgi:hypothetical protein|nr:hypothetical protein [Bacteroidales bacterium]
METVGRTKHQCTILLIMKKKILLPIVAIAMIVTAGVNYRTINNSDNQGLLDLASLVKLSFANAEDPAPGGEQDGTLVTCPNCGSAGCDGSACLPDYVTIEGISGCLGNSYGC